MLARNAIKPRFELNKKKRDEFSLNVHIILLFLIIHVDRMS